MDRKGWIILILCGIGMVLAYNSTVSDKQNRNAIAKQEQAAKDKEKQGGSGDSSTGEGSEGDENDGNSGATDTTAPAKQDLKEETYTLYSKNSKGNVVEYVFTNKGGGVKAAKLLNESEGPDGKVIINRYGTQPIGALAEDEGEFANIVYPSDRVKKTENSITFKHKLKSGLEIEKYWTFESNDVPSSEYRLKLQLTLKNESGDAIKLKDYAVTTGITAPLFQEERPDLCKWFYYQDGDYESGSSSPFKDGWLWGKAVEVDVHTVQNLEYLGVSNQFYSTILMPETPGKKIWVDDKNVELDSGEGELMAYVAGVTLPDHDLVKGNSARYVYRFYTGPRKQSAVSKISTNTDETMSYGWYGFGAPWMNIGINWIHDVMAVRIHEKWSWGIAIVILTLFVRIIIWPLHNKSTRTMKRMGKLTPMMKEIREKYSDNPQKVQQETMKLYRKYKINPLGGCLPILVQMPIFFAVFGMLTNAVELRGEGFLWVKDLSQQENVWTIPGLGLPLNILPITMAVTMILQMRMTPSTGDKLQRRIFMLLPVVFFVFCYSFASALALYWTVQNIISIGQTWLMQRLPEPELEEAAASDNSSKPKKKGLMEKMAEKVEQAQRQREAAMAAKTGNDVPKYEEKSKQPGGKTNKDKKKSPKTGG